MASTNARTSAVRISPREPVPFNRLRSTLCSLANRRAFGEILSSAVRSPVVSVVTTVVVCVISLVLRLPDTVWAVSVGGASPGLTSQAIVWPTGTTSPPCTFTPKRIPSPGDSISMTALSVSTSSRGSPLATVWPSCFSHDISFPVSCAISSAGITTLMGISLPVIKQHITNTPLPRTRTPRCRCCLRHAAKLACRLRRPASRLVQSYLPAAAKTVSARASLQFV